ncbi:AsmA-like C-terminal region-containing protein [Acetobacter estunensis]|uniref:AsmA family protein n=1 Tax=Acetobacter estunensis TaxID=104097 RepID=UPI001C2CD8CE|nr:hypothetical protein [Acetobacter estunensis]MBV1835903.1 hypothetical protein [Acetobacter estunensis]
MRRSTRIALITLGLGLAAATTTTLALWQVDLRTFATRKLAAATGRAVHIGALHVTPGQWLTVDMDDVSIGNIPHGSRPEMITLGHLHGHIRLTSLLHGPIETRDLIITRFSGLFERTPDRTPNWRFGPPSSHPDTASKSSGMSGFPGLRQATIHESEVIYRSAKGHSYRIGLDNVTLVSSDDHAPLRMNVSGSYNAAPIVLTAQLGPITTLRQSNRPATLDLHATSGDLTLDLNGTATDLLNFDGVDGALRLNTPTSAPLMAFAGEKPDTFPLALALDGHFIHTGDDWKLSHTHGHLGDSPITDADVTFSEGSKGAPDRISGTMDFSRLDLNALISPTKSAQPSRPDTDIPFLAPAKPDPLLNVRLSAKNVRYNALTFTDASVALVQKPGLVDVPSLVFDWLGGHIAASGIIRTAARGSDIQANVDVTRADIDRFRKQAGFAPIPINGSLSLRAAVTAQGVRTLNQATRIADLQAVAGMNEGAIAQEVIGVASTDIGLLFRRKGGTTPVTCLLGALTLHQGNGTVMPLRIRTGIGSIVGAARFDLVARRFDLAFQSRAAAALALDIPIRVSGPFDRPAIGLAGWSDGGRALLKSANTITTLPPALVSFSTGRACLRPVP